jgi:hypothetical protein
VELALIVLKQGVHELVRAVEKGKITITTAAKLAKLPPDAQRRVVAEIVAGTPTAVALIVTGAEKPEPPCFDDRTLSQALTQMRKLLDLRAAAYGPCEAYRQTRDQLDLTHRALSRWRTERLNEPVPLIVDDFCRRVPLKVIPAFQTAEEIKILCGQLDAIIRQIEGLSRRPGGTLIQAQFQLPRLHEVRKALWDAQAVSVCPYCWGSVAACGTCRGFAWVPARGWACFQS